YIQLKNNTNTEILAQISGEKDTFFSSNFYVRKNHKAFKDKIFSIENDSDRLNDKIVMNGELILFGDDDKKFSTSPLDPYEVFTFKNLEGEYYQRFESGVEFISNNMWADYDFTFSSNKKPTAVDIQGGLNIRDKLTMGDNGMKIVGQNDNNGKGFDFIVI
ncbi:hypothetical protein, partial [Clostridium perfringens]|uniref:hypothetical protein n=1 Tax=Clostridium perfringens TaxID=1502 RepID=UPI002ACEF961